MNYHRKFRDEIVKFVIAARVNGRLFREIAGMVTRRFNFKEEITKRQIEGIIYRYKSGKQKLASCTKKKERVFTWKVGQTRFNSRNKTVYYRWREHQKGECYWAGSMPLHRWIWEQAYGEVPEGQYISFKDGNRKNVELSNLELVQNQKEAYRQMRQYYKSKSWQKVRRIFEEGTKDLPGSDPE